MGEIYIEENRAYQIDLRKADWSIELHPLYRITHLDLADVDYICELHGQILFIEYKNAKIAVERGFTQAAQAFNPASDEKIANMARKFFDSYFYVASHHQKSPIHYIYILEWPKDDVMTRKMLREKIAKKLPFDYQKQEHLTPLLINEFQVMSIEEWNQVYTDAPISRITYESR